MHDILSIFTFIWLGIPFQVKFSNSHLNRGVEVAPVNGIVKAIALDLIPERIFEFSKNKVDASGV